MLFLPNQGVGASAQEDGRPVQRRCTASRVSSQLRGLRSQDSLSGAGHQTFVPFLTHSSHQFMTTFYSQKLNVLLANAVHFGGWFGPWAQGPLGSPTGFCARKGLPRAHTWPGWQASRPWVAQHCFRKLVWVMASAGSGEFRRKSMAGITRERELTKVLVGHAS